MKDITLKIVGKHFYEGTEEDQMEFVTEGKINKENGQVYVIYEESEFSGTPGQTTRLTISDSMVFMSREGEGEGLAKEIKFQRGERSQGVMETPFGIIPMEVLTNSIENTISYEEKGKVNIDYSVSLKGLSESRSTLNIEILKMS